MFETIEIRMDSEQQFQKRYRLTEILGFNCSPKEVYDEAYRGAPPVIPHHNTVLLAKQLSVILPRRCSKQTVKAAPLQRQAQSMLRPARTSSAGAVNIIMPSRSPSPTDAKGCDAYPPLPRRLALTGGEAQPAREAQVGGMLQGLCDASSQSEGSQPIVARDGSERDARPATPGHCGRGGRPAAGC